MTSKYTFAVGLFEPKGRCTVRANTYNEAIDRARCEMDRRMERKGEEPPVGWDLELINITGPKS